MKYFIFRSEQLLNTLSREAYEIITLQQGSGTLGELIQALDISAIKNCNAKQIWIDFTYTKGQQNKVKLSGYRFGSWTCPEEWMLILTPNTNWNQYVPNPEEEDLDRCLMPPPSWIPPRRT